MENHTKNHQKPMKTNEKPMKTNEKQWKTNEKLWKTNQNQWKTMKNLQKPWEKNVFVTKTMRILRKNTFLLQNQWESLGKTRFY